MSKYNNPGKVDVEQAAQSIVARGGGWSSKWEGNHKHHTAYLKSEDWHLSWDEDQDGSISNVHSDKNGRSYIWYSK